MTEEKRNKKLLNKKRQETHRELLYQGYLKRQETKVAPKDTCISLQHINKIYPNHVQAVYDFSLDIKDKEFIVFVGPSGCGKSTTLRMIAGLEDITYGDLFISGRYANELLPKERDIAMVFQSYALYPNMTVFDNIAFSLKLKHLPKQEIKERVIKAAKMLGIDEYLDRKPSALSGGQRQRVALGRAIVRDVKVFLMDEPLSNLDAKFRVAMRSEIVNLHKTIGSTTIYVTHDQTEAMSMADRIVVMKDGWVQQIGTPREIYEKPANLFTATFIGAPAMNVLDIAYNANSVTLPNGFVINLTKEQQKTINEFIDSQIKHYEEEKKIYEEKLEKKIYELSHVGYKRDIDNYSKKCLKLKNKIIEYQNDLEEVEDQAVEAELKTLLTEKQEELNKLTTEGLKEIENKEYPVLDEEKLNIKKERDSMYNILLKDLAEVENKLSYYQDAKKNNNLKLAFGIRPENLLDDRLMTLCKNPSKPLDLKVDIAELLGDQYYLHTQINDVHIIAKSSTDKNIKSGDVIQLFIDLDKIYLFDKESSLRII